MNLPPPMITKISRPWLRRMVGAALLAMLACDTAAAVEVLEGTTRYDGGRFKTRYDVVIDAPPAAVRPVLTDYARVYRLSPMVTSSQIIKRTRDGRQRLKLVTRPCVLFLCKTVIKVQDIRRVGRDTVISDVVPAGHFENGHERWQILEYHGRTRVVYEADVQPRFFVPPFIGPMIIEAKIDDMLKDVAHRLERQARDQFAGGR